ncbi:rhodanese-like domain-containing protein [Coxiella endosymbiont of Ornithodoros amblus]|uniref:rhodanese-like domain-containing protein n=1 Tax=Coxiella endosymbiont of Ornithodoros amblus TaxID=1656166 RepID=UPI00244DDA42|nr:rhodanese-like domain-containing protein [Coxiella endosymbiont of Ornithodoros amblus]MBW5802682.1 rhodanese-like domain-containing protein [Coxiella endosymbiont of Ornithodoros amblus]
MVTMEQLPEFIARHWLLAAAFIIALIALLVIEIRNKGLSGKYRLTLQQAVRLINNEKAMIVDIRDVDAYRKGHITNAINIPGTELDKHLQHLEQYKQQPIILVCAMGQKSGLLRNKLHKNGCEKVYLMIGGMNAWNSANMPVVK